MGAIPSYSEAILTLDVWTSILAHSPGSRISIHREFLAEHVGTGLELYHVACASYVGHTQVSAVGLFCPERVLSLILDTE